MNCSNRSQSLHCFIVEAEAAQAVMQLLLTACHFAPHVVSGWFFKKTISFKTFFIEQIIQIRSTDLESELCDLVSNVGFGKFVIKYKSLLSTAALCWPAALYTPERTLKSRSSFTKITIMITTTIMIIYTGLPSRAVPLCGWGGTQWHPEALQPQRQHHQHLPGSGAQQSTLLLQAGGGGRWLQ